MVQVVAVYVLILSTTAVLALGVAFGAWVQRKSFSAWPVVALMLGVSVWCATEAAMWSSSSLEQQAFWLKLTYPAVSLTVVGLTVFALDIAEQRRWLTPKGIAIISVPQVIACAMAILNPSELFYAGYSTQQIGAHTHYVAQNGPLFWVYIVVAYGTMLVALGILLRTSLKATPEKRVQTRIVLVGALVPFLVSVFNQFMRVQIEGIESTAFFLTGLIFLLALVRGRLLDPSGRLITPAHMLEAERRQEQLQTTNRELGDELQASRHREDRLYDQATHDALTNLSNRRALEDDLVREVARAQRTNSTIAFLLFDLDDFKPVNDVHSHLAGDSALKMVSEVLMRGSRQDDIMCRWGATSSSSSCPGLM